MGRGGKMPKALSKIKQTAKEIFEIGAKTCEKWDKNYFKDDPNYQCIVKKWEQVDVSQLVAWEAIAKWYFKRIKKGNLKCQKKHRTQLDHQ